MPAQRWRLILARTGAAPDLSQRELMAAWTAALDEAGLRDPRAETLTRFVPGAPIPAGLTADREPADLFLPVARPAPDVRRRLGATVPSGYRLVELHDVWVGEPALPGLVVAGDYCVDVDVGPPAGAGRDRTPPADDRLREGVAVLLAATVLERPGSRPGRGTAGNLRPLIEDIRVVSDHELWMRLRFDPTLGTGRPEEVVAALGAVTGLALVATRRHRERLWLRDERPR